MPAGTVTFLFTDVEGSTRFWEQHPDAMRHALARHDTLAEALVESLGGTLVRSRGEGDSLFAVFPRASDAVAAAAAFQQALITEPWPAAVSLRVRMALHTGEADLRDGSYYGSEVNRCARLRAVAHGGQVLLSAATQELVRDILPHGVSLRDLGLHRLRDLQRAEHVYQLLQADLPVEFPPLQSLDALPNNLPQQVTSFVGREQPIEEVKHLLATTRLLTITGAGGTGKTRLALQVAADLLPEYADGVWVVELAPLAEAGLVPQAAATVLGMRELPGQTMVQMLVEALKPKRLLLVLDNCEHLLAACAALADALLRGCPGVRLLATSREGLNTAGETTYRLPSLSLPDPRQLPASVESLSQYEAVRLFIDRATAAVPAFRVTNQNAPAVAQVCSRLDGIPLAIELAAARVKVLPVEKINERLDDRFRLLTGGSRTALPRQQTLRALIDWSHDLLSEAERALLRRLSVFAGGWTLEAAESICAGGHPDSGPCIEQWEVLDLLAALAEKSLVAYEERGGEPWYWMLETVRQYSRDRLLEAEEAEAVGHRHQGWYLELAERAEPELSGPQQAVWNHRLAAERDNLRTALRWLEERGQVEAGLRLGAALCLFWARGGYHSEGRNRLAALLALPGASEHTGARAKALYVGGALAFYQGDYTVARTLLEESVSICREVGDRRLLADAVSNLGHASNAQSDYAAARTYYEQSLALRQEFGTDRDIALSYRSLADVAANQGDCETARSLYEESLSICRRLEDAHSIAWVAGCLGDLARRQSDYRAARSLHEESLKIFRGLNDMQCLPRALCGLAKLACCQGDYGAACSLYEESLAIRRELGAKRGVAECLEGLAEAAGSREEWDRAARLLAAAAALREAVGSSLPPPDRAEYERNVAAARTALSEKTFAAACAEGRAMTLGEAINYALGEASHTGSSSSR
jgi:predicted ATPase/class 3 adenylate cyclase/Tfp pilus assembly protein PilF